VGFNAGMENALWDRLSAEIRREVDSLVSAGRNVQAIALMREYAGLPTPHLYDCVDVLHRGHAWRQFGVDSRVSLRLMRSIMARWTTASER
jgi:hypothetical protein